MLVACKMSLGQNNNILYNVCLRKQVGDRNSHFISLGVYPWKASNSFTKIKESI
jgi:hypothetical protein